MEQSVLQPHLMRISDVQWIFVISIIQSIVIVSMTTSIVDKDCTQMKLPQWEKIQYKVFQHQLIQLCEVTKFLYLAFDPMVLHLVVNY